MSYGLGIDIGTTFTAAATLRGDRAQILPLGDRAPSIPSVVLLREDGQLLVGESAQRRGLTQPQRIAREFKRRFGQPEPLLLGGTPYSPEALTARLLAAVVEIATAREGAPPSRVCLTHPANWGPFKLDLLRQVIRLSGVSAPVRFTTEPEAAAVFYAREQRVDAGRVVAVYDLGGGTFDAAVLRKTSTGFEILGQPEGIEQLGGIDIDAAVFHHVTQSFGERLAELDEDDPAAVSAVARLRQECVDAKQALSSDTDTSIPVLLPGVSTDVRLTRAELEQMVRPMLGGTIHALRRALDSAGVTPPDVTSVLLVGGASRMPIVAQLVGADLGRPVAVDAHPKHAVALGAAWSCEEAPAPSGPVPIVDPVPPPTEAISYDDLFADQAPPAPDRDGDRPTLPGSGQRGPSAGPGSDEPLARTLYVDPPPAPPPGAPGQEYSARRSRMPLAAAILLVLVLAAGVAFAGGQLGWWSGDDDPEDGRSSAAGPREELDGIVEDDRDRVTEELTDRWAPQLAVRIPEMVNPNGNTYTYDQILQEYDDTRERYDTLLVWTDDYPASFKLTGAYAFVVADPVDTPEDALAWCETEGFVPDDCRARRVSDTGDPDSNDQRRP